jgi:hypothetical protein
MLWLKADKTEARAGRSNRGYATNILCIFQGTYQPILALALQRGHEFLLLLVAGCSGGVDIDSEARA